MYKLLAVCLLALFSSSIFAQTVIPPTCATSAEPAEDCASACISCNFSGYMGNTAGFAPSGAPVCPGYAINNDQWFGFVAGASAAIFTATPSNCTGGNGIQLAVYPAGCNDEPIVCNGGCTGCGNVPQSVSVASLTPGSNYYLMIDGFAGDECDFSISVVPPIAVQAPPLGPSGNLSGPMILCPGATASFSMQLVQGAGFYTWSSATPGVLFNGEEGPATFEAPSGRTVQVTVPANFTGPISICCEPASSCYSGTEVCRTVNVVPLPPTILPTMKVCNEDAPYTLPWGDEVYNSGTYTNVLTSYLGCDSMVSQQVQVLSPIITNLTRYICKGDSVSVCGNKIAAQGTYTYVCDSYLGCDSTINLTLNVLSPVAKIVGSTIIGCEMNQVVLQSLPSPNFPGVSIKTWTFNGTLIGMGESILVSDTGTYSLCTRMIAGGTLCTVCDQVKVTKDSTYIAISTQNGILGCSGSNSATISAGVQVSNPTFQWAGPNDFASDLAAPLVTELGIYTVTVTTASGCVGTATVSVSQNQAPINVAAVGDTLNCVQLLGGLQASSTTPNTTFLWTGPGLNTSNPNPLVSIPGTYTVVVTDAQGCTNSATVEVVAYTDPAVIDSTFVVENNCTFPVTVVAETAQSGLWYAWSGPNNLIFDTPIFETTIAGDYTLVVTAPLSGCTSSTTVTVPDWGPPVVSIQPVTLNCDGSATLLAVADADVTLQWFNPAGNPVSGNPIVSDTFGVYSVVATNPEWGCTSSQQFTLVPQPVLNVVGAASNPTAGLNNGAIDLTVSNGNVPYTVQWTYNGQIFSSQEDLSDLGEGTYSVVVTNTLTGCSATATFVLVTVGQNEVFLPDAQWDIVPNPNNGSFNLIQRHQPLTGGYELRVLDALGRQVLLQTGQQLAVNQSVQITNPVAGMYILQLQLADGRYWVGRLLVR